MQAGTSPRVPIPLEDPPRLIPLEDPRFLMPLRERFFFDTFFSSEWEVKKKRLISSSSTYFHQNVDLLNWNFEQAPYPLAGKSHIPYSNFKKSPAVK